MLELYNNHPLLMGQEGQRNLPETYWHDKVQERYPCGSKAELFRRSQAVFYKLVAKLNGNDRVLETNPMQPEERLLDTLTGPSIDIIAPTFTVNQEGLTKTVMIIEDHLHSNETSYTMGKTTIVQRLLRLALVDWQVRHFLGLKRGEKVSADDLINKLSQETETQGKSIEIPKFSASPIKLLAGDVTFIGASKEEKLMAMATVGTKEDFLFDIARSGIRRLLKNYNRIDPNIMAAQSEITTKLNLEDSIWADIREAHPIDEVIILTTNQSWLPLARWQNSMEGTEANTELRLQLQNNPIYIASEIGYWDIDPQTHRRQVETIMADINQSPKVRYLCMGDPKNGYTLRNAAKLIKKEFQVPGHEAVI